MTEARTTFPNPGSHQDALCLPPLLGVAKVPNSHVCCKAVPEIHVTRVGNTSWSRSRF